jgi:hypothetical protein
MTAAEEMRRHFAKRVYERYGIVLQPPRDIRAIEDAIFAERCPVLARFTESRTAYLATVPSCARLIIALYDSSVPAVVTALPMTAIVKRQRELAP